MGCSGLNWFVCVFVCVVGCCCGESVGSGLGGKLGRFALVLVYSCLVLLVLWWGAGMRNGKRKRKQKRKRKRKQDRKTENEIQNAFLASLIPLPLGVHLELSEIFLYSTMYRSGIKK